MYDGKSPLTILELHKSSLSVYSVELTHKSQRKVCFKITMRSVKIHMSFWIIQAGLEFMKVYNLDIVCLNEVNQFWDITESVRREILCT